MTGSGRMPSACILRDRNSTELGELGEFKICSARRRDAIAVTICEFRLASASEMQTRSLRRKALRSLVTIACVVLSLPGAALMLLAGLAMPFEHCNVGIPPLDCRVQHGTAVLMLPVAAIAWLAYFSMASCWIGGRSESPFTLKAGTAAATAYFALALPGLRAGDWLVVLVGGSLPVLPAMLHACYLLWFFWRLDRHQARAETLG